MAKSKTKRKPKANRPIEVDDVVLVPVSFMSDFAAFTNLMRSWISRAAEIADRRNFKAPITTTAIDANGKRFFVIEITSFEQVGPNFNNMKEFNPDAGTMPVVLVIEDAKGRIVRARIQLETQAFQ